MRFSIVGRQLYRATERVDRRLYASGLEILRRDVVVRARLGGPRANLGFGRRSIYPCRDSTARTMSSARRGITSIHSAAISSVDFGPQRTAVGGLAGLLGLRLELS